MKKYILIGLVAGTVVSLALYYFRRRKFDGMEFQDFVGSAAIADDLFGKAFRELPDKL